MRTDRLAFGFTNGLGNFIFLTAAVKVLRKRGYNDITLITDEANPCNKRNLSLLEEVYPYAFNSLETSFDESKYDQFFLCGWSRPGVATSYMQENNIKIPVMQWNFFGYHEVELYLKMVGASWKDFDGYLFDVADKPILKSPHPRIALAQCSGSKQAEKKSWPYFPEFSVALKKLGYSVILVGQGDELESCVFDEDFRNKTSISEVGKVLSQCDLLVAPSTGLTIVADAVKTSVLLLEGPMFTAKSHPLLADYRIVRSFISCAPCFQTPLWSCCNDALCMKNITVNQVLKEVISYKAVKSKRVFSTCSVEKTEKQDQRKHHIAYALACKDRYPLLKACLTSFKNSNPIEGTLFVVNDCSLDLRVDDLLKSLSIEGIKIECIKLPFKHKKSKGIRSAKLYNLLRSTVLNSKEVFNYVALIDSDLLFKKNWLQKEINIYEEVQKTHKISALTGFAYRAKDDSKVYSCKYGSYCLNDKISGQFLMSFDFMQKYFGTFDEMAASADISKFEEMSKKGYIGIKTIPSLVQHAGTYSSSLHYKFGASVEDFI